MRLNELMESQELDELNLGKAARTVAKGAGKAIGGVAAGVGAVAGIPGGAKQAFMKGKQAAQDVIGGTGQGADAPELATEPTAAPAQPSGFGAGVKAGLGAGVATPSQSAYARIKADIDKLDRKSKQRILALLQKSLSAPAPSKTTKATIPPKTSA